MLKMRDYSDFSKEELLNLVKKQEQELKKKKYGLVWDSEKEPEQIVVDCENNIPVLERIKSKEINTDEDESDANILIEGDNYHALTCLNYTHKGRIDVIYIDPPYNTGKPDEWKYNDKFVDKEDSYRHSKWLNMMEKRLRLAKNVISEKGVIFISIDDNEQANLKLLCDSIFGENNFINNIIWQRASGGGSAKGIVTGHDYILVYQRNLPVKNFLGDKVDSKRFGKDKIVEENGKKFFINDDVVRKIFGKYEQGVERRCYFEELDDYRNEKQIAEIKGKLKNKEYFLLKQDNGKNFIARLDPLDSRKKMYSIIQGVLNNLGANEMSNLDIEFSYPKPTLLLRKIITSVSKKNDLILDFFAGSGTMGQAVLELNKEDGGNRKFILCTNNENNICEKVTYPRIKKVIEGYNVISRNEKILLENKGLGGNLCYFKTDLIPVGERETIRKISDKKRIELTSKAGQMIAIKEDTLEEIELDGFYQIFESKDQKRKTGIYFRENESQFEELVEKLKGSKSSLYIFSYGKIDKTSYKVNKNVRIEDIPEPILEIYKEINQTLK